LRRRIPPHERFPVWMIVALEGGCGLDKLGRSRNRPCCINIARERDIGSVHIDLRIGRGQGGEVVGPSRGREGVRNSSLLSHYLSVLGSLTVACSALLRSPQIQRHGRHDWGNCFLLLSQLWLPRRWIRLSWSTVESRTVVTSQVKTMVPLVPYTTPD